MKERLARAFEHANKRVALAAFVTAGYPSAKATPGILDALVEGGADLIELGVPFSDPVVDGPSIQRSSKIALDNGMNLQLALDIAAGFRDRHPDVPLVMMGYSNPFLSFGVKRFSQKARSSGVDGAIIVDIPVERTGDWKPELAECDVAMVLLASPTTAADRMRLIAQQSEGFVYCVSLKGVTGADSFRADRVENLVSQLKEGTQLPIIVGFGIRTPEQARSAASIADGIAVGSGLADLIGDCAPADLAQRVRDYIGELAAACRRE